MPRRHPRRPEEPPPLRPIGGVAPRWSQVEGWVVQMSTKGGATCPSCRRPIREGARHLVAWPDGEADLRRHFHTECWRQELRRGGPTL